MDARRLAKEQRARARIRKYAFLDRPQAWCTGTSKAFWALRAAGQYEEAKALLEAKDKAKPSDAEALWEISQLHEAALFGYFGDCYAVDAWCNAAYELGHPMALLYNDGLEDMTGPEVDTLASYVEATGDAHAMWVCYKRRPGTNIMDERSLELIRLGLASGNTRMAFVAYRAGICSSKVPADMGHAQACYEYGRAIGVENGAIEYWRRGAAQGHGLCSHMLFRYLSAHEAAILAVHPWQSHDAYEWMRGRWRHPYAVDYDADPTERIRELFVYAYAKKMLSDCPQLKALIVMHESICQAAQSASLYFYWLLRNNCFPKDIAVLVAKEVWASRASETELWWTPEINAALGSAGISTGYDYSKKRRRLC